MIKEKTNNLCREAIFPNDSGRVPEIKFPQRDLIFFFWRGKGVVNFRKKKRTKEKITGQQEWYIVQERKVMFPPNNSGSERKKEKEKKELKRKN